MSTFFSNSHISSGSLSSFQSEQTTSSRSSNPSLLCRKSSLDSIISFNPIVFCSFNLNTFFSQLYPRISADLSVKSACIKAKIRSVACLFFSFKLRMRCRSFLRPLSLACEEQYSASSFAVVEVVLSS